MSLTPKRSKFELDIDVGHTLSKPTVLVGDVHGNVKALQANLRGPQLTGPDGEWIAKGTDMVLAGDLFADRYKDDFRIAAYVLELRKQMRAAGDELILLLGNHDLEAANFLLGGIKRPLASVNMLTAKDGTRVLRGIQALGQNMSPKRARTEEECFQDRPKDATFLKRFMASKRGAQVAEVLSSMELWRQAGNVLFQHTPPTRRTLAELTGCLDEETEGVLDDLFHGRPAFPVSGMQEVWFDKANTMLNANNRYIAIPQERDSAWDVLQREGIQVLAFGHDFGSAGHTKKTLPTAPSTYWVQIATSVKPQTTTKGCMKPFLCFASTQEAQ